MRYLAGEEILVLHAAILERTGGALGLRDTGLLLSAVERPKMKFGGKELYPDLFSKTACYFDSLARHHVFVDGNKRTSFAACVRFLYINGYDFTANNNDVESFVIDAVVKKRDIHHVAAWFKKHSKKM